MFFAGSINCCVCGQSHKLNPTSGPYYVNTCAHIVTCKTCVRRVPKECPSCHKPSETGMTNIFEKNPNPNGVQPYYLQSTASQVDRVMKSGVKKVRQFQKTLKQQASRTLERRFPPLRKLSKKTIDSKETLTKTREKKEQCRAKVVNLQRINNSPQKNNNSPSTFPFDFSSFQLNSPVSVPPTPAPPAHQSVKPTNYPQRPSVTTTHQNVGSNVQRGNTAQQQRFGSSTVFQQRSSTSNTQNGPSTQQQQNSSTTNSQNAPSIYQQRNSSINSNQNAPSIYQQRNSSINSNQNAPSIYQQRNSSINSNQNAPSTRNPLGNTCQQRSTTTTYRNISSNSQRVNTFPQLGSPTTTFQRKESVNPPNSPSIYQRGSLINSNQKVPAQNGPTTTRKNGPSVFQRGSVTAARSSTHQNGTASTRENEKSPLRKIFSPTIHKYKRFSPVPFDTPQRDLTPGRRVITPEVLERINAKASAPFRNLKSL